MWTTNNGTYFVETEEDKIDKLIEIIKQYTKLTNKLIDLIEKQKFDKPPQKWYNFDRMDKYTK